MKKLLVVGCMLVLSCTTKNNQNHLQNVELKPLVLDVEKVKPDFCYELKNRGIVGSVYMRDMNNKMHEIQLIGSGSGIAVYTHRQFQYTGEDGLPKIAVQITVKEGGSFEKEGTTFGKTGIISFDYSSSSSFYSPEKITELERAAYDNFLNAQIDTQRCKPLKAKECAISCGDYSNPNFESCSLNKKVLKCPGYTADRIEGVCFTDCGTAFKGDAKGYMRCIDAKFLIADSWLYETCNDFAQHTCNIDCSALPSSAGKRKCDANQAVRCQ